MVKPSTVLFGLAGLGGLLAILAIAKAAPSAPPPTTGSLSISSSPAGAEIFLDGTDQGMVTPAKITSMPAGIHTYKLTLAGYSDSTGTFIITAGQTAIVAAVLVPACAPNWQCEQPLNGYENDGCGNRRANPACNPPPPPCVPNWQCEQPLNGFESDGCGGRRVSPNLGCQPPTPPPSVDGISTTDPVLANQQIIAYYQARVPLCDRWAYIQATIGQKVIDWGVARWGWDANSVYNAMTSFIPDNPCGAQFVMINAGWDPIIYAYLNPRLPSCNRWAWVHANIIQIATDIGYGVNYTQLEEGIRKGYADIPCV